MKLTARDHAYVYGVIAQATLKMHPEAREVIEESIRIYGRQRGARMAQTSQYFGNGTSMQDYLAYGEWAPAPGEMDIEIPQTSPSSVWNVKKCPWNMEWVEEEMLDVGKLYCDFVDVALVEGFNPDLVLGIGKTQTRGDEYCYFKWTDADMGPKQVAENKMIQEKVGTARLRSWLFHMAHIYKTMNEYICEELGLESKDKIFAQVDSLLIKRYGKEIVDSLHSGMIIDYWVSPTTIDTDKVLSLLHL